VKDALSVLRVLENPFDEVSWFRVLQLPEGIGPATARRMLDDLGVTAGRDEDRPSPLERFLSEPISVPQPAVDGIQELRDALADCLDRDLPAAVQIERIRGFLGPVFARRYEAPAARLRDLEELELLAAEAPTRGRFLADLTLDPPSSTSDLAGPPWLDEDWLILSTIHSAKGLEFDVVHVIHAADGMIPSDMATGDDDEIEEERRLLYVAMTRARDALHVYHPLRYYRRPRGLEDPHAYAQRSRFLPDEVLDHFEVSGPLEARGPDDAIAVSGTASVDRFLASLWSE
jgi:DNA helicase-2/ATP-dependent DNA helicase PcrA